MAMRRWIATAMWLACAIHMAARSSFMTRWESIVAVHSIAPDIDHLRFELESEGSEWAEVSCDIPKSASTHTQLIAFDKCVHSLSQHPSMPPFLRRRLTLDDIDVFTRFVMSIAFFKYEREWLALGRQAVDEINVAARRPT
jgi:hypothetical protein